MSKDILDLHRRVHSEFGGLLDYVWKCPRLIESEIESERHKLDAYFPLSDDPERLKLRELRAYYENENLFGRFPAFMASANLFLAASLFEHFLLELCRKLESQGPPTLAQQKGNGISRYFRFLRSSGFCLEKLDFYAEVDAAIEIRNALLHANGEIEICRKSSKLKSIVDNQLYMTPERRCKLDKNDLFQQPEVTIYQTPPKLKINNDYAYRATAYFKDFLLQLTQQVVQQTP